MKPASREMTLTAATAHRYRMSEAAQITPAEDGCVVVKHLISERTYKFGGKESRVIGLLQAGDGLADVDGIDEQFIANLISFLWQKSLLVPNDASIVEQFLLIEPATPLWGQRASIEAAGPGDICYVGIPYGYGNCASTAAKDAPAALRQWLRTHRLDNRSILNERTPARYFPAGLEMRAARMQALHRQERVKDLGDLYIYPYEDAGAIFGRVERLAATLVRQDVVPVFVGGDHAITFPILKGIGARFGAFDVLHFDAHTDCYQTPVDRLYAAVANNHHGNFLSRALAECDGIRHVHQWGVRGINNFGSFLPSRVTSRTAAELIDALRTDGLEPLPGDLPVYVTIDIDVIDPTIAPGTGSPVPGGITWEHLFVALERLLRNRRVVGIDLVELDAGADARGVTQHGAAHLLALLPGFIEG